MTRLKEILNDAGVKHKHAARQCNMTPSDFSSLCSGRLLPGREMAQQVASGVSVVVGENVTPEDLWPGLEWGNE